MHQKAHEHVFAIQKVQKMASHTINRLKYFISQLTNSIIHKVEYIYVLAEAFTQIFQHLYF